MAEQYGAKPELAHPEARRRGDAEGSRLRLRVTGTVLFARYRRRGPRRRHAPELVIDDPREQVVACRTDNHPSVDEETGRAGHADAGPFVLRHFPRIFVLARGQTLIELVTIDAGLG